MLLLIHREEEKGTKSAFSEFLLMHGMHLLQYQLAKSHISPLTYPFSHFHVHDQTASPEVHLT